MSGHDTLASLLPSVPIFLAAGLVSGTAYFAALRRGVRIAIARGAWLRYAVLALARIAMAALFFAFAIRWSVFSLLAAFMGFLTARQLAVRAARRPE